MIQVTFTVVVSDETIERLRESSGNQSLVDEIVKLAEQSVMTGRYTSIAVRDTDADEDDDHLRELQYDWEI